MTAGTRPSSIVASAAAWAAALATHPQRRFICVVGFLRTWDRC
jgi:hypothetical protein